MKENNYILVPRVSIQPNYIAVFKQPQLLNGRRFPRRKKFIMPISNKHQGVVSNKSAAKIKKAINWLLLLARDKKVSLPGSSKNWKFRLSFITLTLASSQFIKSHIFEELYDQLLLDIENGLIDIDDLESIYFKHTDNEIKEICLNQFLVEARKKWNVKNYLWRAEPQINGNIHFHILCDCFIPHFELRDTWNRLQNKLGYVESYREEMLAFHRGGFNIRQHLLSTWSYKDQLRAYRTGSKQDWNSPNSTDIHSVLHIRDLPDYLSKYCTKNEGVRQIKGRLWSLSESLSCLKGVIEDIDSEISEELSEIVKRFPDKIIHHDYYTILLVSCYMWAKFNKGRIYTEFRNYIFDKRNDTS